jgi:hypothetical protein
MLLKTSHPALRKLRNIYYRFIIYKAYRKFSASNLFEYRIYVNYPFNELTRLSEEFGSDKGSTLEKNPYPWQAHSYTTFYNHTFARNRENIKYVFECGIGSSDETVTSNMTATGATGASLRMWREYFPNAEIYGADIDPKAIFNEERIQTYVMDQTDKESIERYWRGIGEFEFDLMVDDGLHSFKAGITLFENSIHKLALDGIYFIEDVNSLDLLKYQDYFKDKQYVVEYITLYHGKNEVSDDCLIRISQT